MKNPDCGKLHRAPGWGKFWMHHSEPKSQHIFFSSAGWNKLLTADPAEPEFPMEPSDPLELC